MSSYDGLDPFFRPRVPEPLADCGKLVRVHKGKASSAFASLLAVFKHPLLGVVKERIAG